MPVVKLLSLYSSKHLIYKFKYYFNLLITHVLTYQSHKDDNSHFLASLFIFQFMLTFPANIHLANHRFCFSLFPRSRKHPRSPYFKNYVVLVTFLEASVQFSCSVVSDSLQPHESQHARPPCPSPAPGVYSKLMSIESVMPSSHLILCCPLLLLPPIPPSIKVFSNESTLRIRWPKYWSFSFSISPSNEHPGLISFRMD